MEKKKLIPRELLKQFIKENNLKTAEDAKDLVKDLFADTIHFTGKWLYRRNDGSFQPVLSTH